MQNTAELIHEDLGYPWISDNAKLFLLIPSLCRDGMFSCFIVISSAQRALTSKRETAVFFSDGTGLRIQDKAVLRYRHYTKTETDATLRALGYDVILELSKDKLLLLPKE